MNKTRRLRYTHQYPIVHNNQRTWKTRENVWLYVISGPAHYRFMAGVEQTKITHKARLRWNNNIAIGDRFTRNQQILIIHAIEDRDGRQRWIDCLCEEKIIHPIAGTI